MPVSTIRDDRIAVVTFSNPPVNALSTGSDLVDGLIREIRAHHDDPAVDALVLRGEGKDFCGGADITDFADDPAILAPIHRLMDTLDSLEKPIVAALDGAVLGGGLELAMACHHRVSTTRARLGLPEVTLGLLPGAGGTQRLPRLVGVAVALDLMLSGRHVTAGEALRHGLVDGVVEADLPGAAMEAARRLAQSGFFRVRDRAVPGSAAQASLDEARRAVAARPGRSKAKTHILDCVEAALTQDFDTARRLERRLFDELMLSEPSRGLRHVFLGERTVARIPDLPPQLPEIPIAKVAIVGAGTMGTSIAICMLNAGLATTLIEPQAARLDQAGARIRQSIERDVEKGRISPDEAAGRLGRFWPADDLGTAFDADLVIEAVFEDLDVKREIFRALDRGARAATILASNTSTLDLDAIAACTERPERVVGMHFFSPANVMRLLEVVRGKATAPAVLAAVMRFARRIGKVGVVAGVSDGFIGNRMFEEYLRQAYFLLEEGALPRQIDDALERWGMAMGPLRVMDLAGQDIGWSIRKRRAVEQPDRPYSRIPDLICEMGRFGQKTGAGYYRYQDGRTPMADPEIDALVVRHSQEIGVRRRPIDDDEIVDRCVYALVNEGARILAEGIAYRPVDIDIVYVHGYGFGAERGGPMFYADRIGLATILKRIEAFAGGYQGWAWQPADLLVRLAGSGSAFGRLNAR